MNKFRYKIFHNENLSEREDAVERNKKLFESHGIQELNSPTVDIDKFEKMYSFIKENDGFNVVEHNNFDLPFPHVSGVIGIWASNWLAWKALLKSDSDYAILVEDDVVVLESFFDSVNAIVDNMPEDWDILSFCIPHTEDKFYDQNIHYIDNLIICKFYQTWSAGGYIINRKGASKLLDHVGANGISMPIDWNIFEQGQGLVNTYNLTPYVQKMTDWHPHCLESYIGKTESRWTALH
jgi:GR25 family glycosyltransferase involved in LPS biosynthesis